MLRILKLLYDWFLQKKKTSNQPNKQKTQCLLILGVFSINE